MQTIYIVEDDDSIRELVTYALQNSGFKVTELVDGDDLLSLCQENQPDLLLLDIMLPHEDGISLLKQLKEHKGTMNMPIIMLTAKSTELDKVKGLDLGADDYITKPFSVMELISRVKAVLRRSEMQKPIAQLKVGNICLDKEKRIVLAGDAEVELTYKEFELLAYLMSYPQIVLSRAQILNALWGYEFEGESRTVDMHIKALRQKLQDCGSYIQTIRNVGYVMKPPDKEGEE